MAEGSYTRYALPASGAVCKPRRQLGLSLIEVLVAMVLAAIGTLGLTALEAIAIRTNHDAHFRTQAILQTQAMANRMQANLAGVDDGEYNALSGIPQQPPSCLTTDSSPTIDCTPAQIAQFDRFEWNTANAALLPSGAGTVTGPDTNGVYAIALTWAENEHSGAVAKTFSFEFKPCPLSAEGIPQCCQTSATGTRECP